METRTQQADGLQQALNEAVLSSGAEATGNESKPRIGSGLAGPGRPRGVRSKLLSVRDAVLEAFDQVGGVEYLVKLANGTQSDRAAFVGLMNKVLPTQINQQVDGGIRLELSWLGARSIGATQAQIPEQRTQVLDLETDSDGKYRIKDPADDDGDAGGTPDAPGGVEDAQRQGG